MLFKYGKSCQYVLVAKIKFSFSCEKRYILLNVSICTCEAFSSVKTKPETHWYIFFWALLIACVFKIYQCVMSVVNTIFLIIQGSARKMEKKFIALNHCVEYVKIFTIQLTSTLFLENIDIKKHNVDICATKFWKRDALELKCDLSAKFDYYSYTFLEKWTMGIRYIVIGNYIF